MSVGLLAGRGALGKRPGFTARNPGALITPYRAWAADDSGVLKSVLGGPNATSVALAGSPSVDLAVKTEFGVAAQNQGAFGSVNYSAWDTGMPGAFNGLSRFSVAYWCYQYASGSGSWWGQSDSSASMFCEGGGATTGVFLRGMSGADLRNAFTEVSVVGEWQHLCWTIGSDVRYYRNGLLKQTAGSTSGSITNAATKGLALMGQWAGTGSATSAVSAYLVDFRIFNSTLSDAQVWSLYDPQTRWDLYWAPSTRAYQFYGVAAGGGGGATVRPVYSLGLMGIQ